MPQNTIKDTDAVTMLRSAMEASSKVYKTARIHLGESLEQDKLMQKYIEKKIAPFNVQHIIWKGVYGDSPKTVEYWFFMTGILIIRGIDGRWSFMGPKITRKQWEKLQSS
jgi:hypothetical protein